MTFTCLASQFGSDLGPACLFFYVTIYIHSCIHNLNAFLYCSNLLFFTVLSSFPSNVFHIFFLFSIQLHFIIIVPHSKYLIPLAVLPVLKPGPNLSLHAAGGVIGHKLPEVLEDFRRLITSLNSKIFYQIKNMYGPQFD